MSIDIFPSHIPKELVEQIDQFAARFDRTKGKFIKQALVSWMALEAKNLQLTLEGLADVDAGRVVNHASVEAWTNSLGKRV